MRVATVIGFIALAGAAAETGVIMFIYLDHAYKARPYWRRSGEGGRRARVVRSASPNRPMEA